MEEYKLSKEWIKKNSDKIKEAYSSAKFHGYDISSKADVLDLLRIIDSLNASEANAEVFSKILRLFARGVKKKFELKEKIKPKRIH